MQIDKVSSRQYKNKIFSICSNLFIFKLPYQYNKKDYHTKYQVIMKFLRHINHGITASVNPLQPVPFKRFIHKNASNTVATRMWPNRSRFRCEPLLRSQTMEEQPFYPSWTLAEWIQVSLLQLLQRFLKSELFMCIWLFCRKTMLNDR